jgi:hypothetical protein
VNIYNKALNVLIVRKFEENKVVIRFLKSKRDRPYNVQKKKDKRTNNDLQNITHKRSSPTIPTKNRRVNPGALEG